MLHETKGTCYFCLECVCGWRTEGWDLVLQSPVCGPCLRRVCQLQEKVYGPRGQRALNLIRHGDWATDEARIAAQAHESTQR
jgi:hypothetical protein